MSWLFRKELLLSEKRRDNKKRLLQNGESQDKDGRYAYRYVDALGKRKAVYSWRLVSTDRVPAGRKADISLREKEKNIQMELSHGVCSGDMTVLELVDRYLGQKKGVRHNTQANYQFVRNIISKEEFGAKRIDRVKLSDAKLFLIKLQEEDGRGYSSIHSIRGVLRPAFQMALDDDLLLRNPFEFQLATVVVNDSVTREAATQEEERKFLKFIKEDNHYSKYYDGMFILFKTGLRISEFCGLTVHDIDFENNLIHVTHQLQRKRDMTYVIEDTKTTSGTRDLPMTDEVRESFERIIANRKPPRVEPIIDGYTGFLFYDKNNSPMVALNWEKYFHYAVGRYNRTYRVQIPKITPHVCRHTYCSNMARAGMNPKTLQYLMGHSDIGVTLNTYTHLGAKDAKEELERLNLAGTSKGKMPRKVVDMS
jgi:integrase